MLRFEFTNQQLDEIKSKIHFTPMQERIIDYRRDEYGRGSYGRDSYGRRGYDTKYRGDEYMGRMYDEYGRYMESRERYVAGEETDKSFHYMVKALEDFIKVLHEEAETPQQKQQLRDSLQRSMM